jgi:hypothetical protein
VTKSGGDSTSKVGPEKTPEPPVPVPRKRKNWDMSTPLSARKLELPSPPPTPRSVIVEEEDNQLKSNLDKIMEMGKAMDDMNLQEESPLVQYVSESLKQFESHMAKKDGEKEEKEEITKEEKDDKRTLRMYFKSGDIVHKRGILLDFSPGIFTYNTHVVVQYMTKGTISHVTMEHDLVPFDDFLVDQFKGARVKPKYSTGPNLIVDSLEKKGNRVTMRGKILVL